MVAARGRLMGELPTGGAMLAVQASESEALESLEGRGASVVLAAVNAPGSIVLSGDEDGILELEDVWRERERMVKRLAVSHAFHSPRMDGMLDRFAEVAEGLSYSEPAIPLVSNLTGESVGVREICSADYWVRHVRETVRFADGVRWLADHDVRSFLELGPEGALSAMVADCLGDEQEAGERSSAVSVLRAERAEDRTFLAALAQVWIGGTDVEWASAFKGSGARRIGLPPYAFQRERYWLQRPAAKGNLATVGQTSTQHPMLGAAVALAGAGGQLLTGQISLQSHPWLADHVVAGHALVPGTGFLELALRAGSEVGCDRVEELVQQAPLLLPERDAVALQVSVGEADDSGRRPIAVYSQAQRPPQGAEDLWTRHAEGMLARHDVAHPQHSLEWPPADATAVPIEGLYEQLAELGLDYGPAFQGLGGVWRRGEDLFAEVSLPPAQENIAQGFLVHPALLDAALHAMGIEAIGDGEGGARVPFAWGGVNLYAVGASALRVRLSRSADGTISILATDPSGVPVASIESLATRSLSAEQLGGSAGADASWLHELQWVDVADVAAGGDELGDLVVLGGELEGTPPLGDRQFADLASLRLAMRDGLARPECVLVDCGQVCEVASPGSVHVRVAEILDLLQSWLADERFVESKLALMTAGAVASAPTEGVSDLAGAAVWGLMCSAQAENPGRLVLLDTDGEPQSAQALRGALACGEDRVALRAGVLRAPRLVRASGRGARLEVPVAGQEWCLQAGLEGSLDELTLRGLEAAGELAAHEVRVGVRAAGVNFRDVLIALGVYPEPAPLGGEGAGVVLEVGPAVADLEPGDRVMGLLDNAFGPAAVGDRRQLARLPDGWSFAEGASVPIVFLTAYYALIDLARVEPGERVLVHAGTGGVGMAAIGLATHLGAEVFATASPGKWGVLREMGLAEDHIASSRDLEFAQRFTAASGGEPMDVVLDCLAGEFVDVSLGLLGEGGRFVEMGKADIRIPEEVASAHPGVSYRAFDLLEAGPEHIQEMFGALSILFSQDVLSPLPLTAWDVRRAPEAFRFMSQARHIGKNVLTLPMPGQFAGTVLITGGTGGLGALIAEHLAGAHGAKRLLLTSRRGRSAENAEELLEQLTAMGADAQIVACDVSDRRQVEELLAAIEPAHPLSAIVHVAGVLDDATIESLSAERVSEVLAPKVDGAWHLHDLTRGLDLGAFVMFSSIAASLGSPGQASYAAANAFLDGLAAERRAQGLPAASLAWGPWLQVGGMADRLDARDSLRIGRAGLAGLTAEQGLALFDQSLERCEPLVAPVRFDGISLKRQAAHAALPGVLRGLVREAPTRAGAARGLFKERLVAAPQSERERLVLDLVLTHTANVLGHANARSVERGESFQGARLRFARQRRATQQAERRRESATRRKHRVRLPLTRVARSPSVERDDSRSGPIQRATSRHFDSGHAPAPACAFRDVRTGGKAIGGARPTSTDSGRLGGARGSLAV